MMGEASWTKRQRKSISFNGKSRKRREVRVVELGDHGEEWMVLSGWRCRGRHA